MAIKNYLKDVKEITAPLNWKSSPDSPPTQLAYVTKPEIDLLVKATLPDKVYYTDSLKIIIKCPT